ncbi:MAG: RIP metalloprotease RseP [Bacteroidales bacterium]|nr:RIP metalloprotease RseP [Bacteroidales bacterium]
MEIFIKISQFLLSLSILVILHELGHFTFAKLFNVRVEKFYLFFNPWFSLFKFKKGDTEYGVGWLPLGGYVKISGMIDESMDKEQMKLPPKPYEFRSKPAWQRLLIMLGGVMVNFVLAILIYVAVLYTWGEEYLPAENVKYGVAVDSLGMQMGLQNGDHILSLDNEYVENFYHIIPDILLNGVKTIQVRRDGELVNLNIPESVIPALIKGKAQLDPRIPFSPYIINGYAGKDSPAKQAGVKVNDELLEVNGKKFDYYDEFQNYLKQNDQLDEVTLKLNRDGEILDITVYLTENNMIGISRDISGFFEFRQIKYSFFESIPAGINKGVVTLNKYIKQFKLIFSPGTKAYESLGGFITIGNIFPGVWDWHSFWSLTAFLSIILAFMNILPIPALDGGHVMFLLYEVVSGRKPGDKFMEYAQITGMVLLIALLLFANGNDVVRLFRK